MLTLQYSHFSTLFFPPILKGKKGGNWRMFNLYSRHASGSRPLPLWFIKARTRKPLPFFAPFVVSRIFIRNHNSMFSDGKSHLICNSERTKKLLPHFTMGIVRKKKKKLKKSPLTYLFFTIYESLYPLISSKWNPWIRIGFNLDRVPAWLWEASGLGNLTSCYIYVRWDFRPVWLSPGDGQW